MIVKNIGSSWVLFPGDFVNAHGLQLGDFIMVYQDLYSNNYVRYTLLKRKFYKTCYMFRLNFIYLFLL